MNKTPIIGVMGPGEGASEYDADTAFEIGRRIAELNWIILTGGRNSGVMEAAMKGAKSVHGLTIGILPDMGESTSPYVDIPIITGLGNARNAINILSSDLIIAIGTGLGTTSEIALAMKSNKSVLLLNQTPESSTFFSSFNYKQLYFPKSISEAIALAFQLLN